MTILQCYSVAVPTPKYTVLTDVSKRPEINKKIINKIWPNTMLLKDTHVEDETLQS